MKFKHGDDLIEVKGGMKYNCVVFYTIVNGKRLEGWTDSVDEAHKRGIRFINTYEDLGVFNTPIKHLKWYHKLWVVPLNSLIKILIFIINRITKAFDKNDNKN